MLARFVYAAVVFGHLVLTAVAAIAKERDAGQHNENGDADADLGCLAEPAGLGIR